jgi:tRNA U34 5-carboxymethylaminomethyl modifying enzyme MnmG/GidA
MVKFILVIKLWWGRAGESASHGITEDLINAGFEAGRMKTGTPPEWMDVLWIIRK